MRAFDWPALLCAVTIAILVALLADRSPPPHLVQTDYCLINERMAVKHPLTGEYLFGWGQGYGPCSQQDIYRHI